MIEGVNGQVVDTASLAKQLDALLVTLHSTTVEVPIVVKEPDVKAEDNQAAQQQAETMISGDVTVTDGDKSWSITPDKIASYMGFRSEMKNGVSTLVPFMDATKLQPLLDQIAPDVVKQPTNATFASDGTKAWVVPGKNGEQLDAEATAQAITAATLESSNRTVNVVIKTKEPNLTTAEAQARGIKDLLTKYSTTYSCPTHRQINVKLAPNTRPTSCSRPVRSTTSTSRSGRAPRPGVGKLAPGIVGPNTARGRPGRRYLPGLDHDVQRRRAGRGSRSPSATTTPSTSTTIPRAGTRRSPAGGKNLRFVNDTDHYIWIRGTSTGITTTIYVYGHQRRTHGPQWSVGDFYNMVPQDHGQDRRPVAAEAGKTAVSDKGQVGKSLKTTRVVTRNGVVIHNDVWTSVWPMYPVTVRWGRRPPQASSTTTTTSGSTTTSSRAP